MSLIIAIEPDREQANQLKELVRRHTKAELILADTTARAIGAIEQRVPDLVLIPAFLSPQDDEALTAALRVREAAAHVQTLTIPVLGAPDVRTTQSGGVLSRLLREQPRAASPDGCDPKVFAEQISEYLERVAQERGPSKLTEVAKPSTNGDGRKHHAPAASAPAAAPAPAPAPQAARVAEKPALVNHSPSEIASNATPETMVTPEEDPMSDDVARALESALASTDSEGLEEGLSSLMERLSAEEWSEPEDSDAPELDLMTALEDAKAPVVPVPVTQPWPEQLRQIESADYKMPTTVPRDAESSPDATNTVSASSAPTVIEQPTPPAQEPSQPPPPAAQAAPATKGRSEWGDLLESLNKELKR